ncbi:universal stress protein [Halalkalicoccus jeotgali]|uniref:UspA domain protein n=1 Tax=Halalkalicoccus jeotgali (strain DSM 18796 / CECT 7217 / JCM 14584 / KCTC 4019 / B3) TaxID=795797 RepID=D8J7P5_HALJB|nr:universal stress protein [Halalkalicoccus jeotgali]ADJ16065.1 UspA domain protein [Halalkalicoccus jeotgali B3]ELY38161.1 UspA domain-containing protein [Halalkalicoccus jeotgali B3]
MTARILVPMDGSELSVKALEFAVEAYPDAEITVLTVVGVPSWFMGEAAGISLSEDVSQAARNHAQSVFDRAREVAADHTTPVETAVAVGNPSRAIVERAEGFDVVVIGGHGRDLSSRLLIGNVAELVVRRSPVPVTVVR